MTNKTTGSIPPPPPGSNFSPRQEALWGLVVLCERAAAAVQQPSVSARLSYAAGRICERLLDEPERANERYLEAFGKDPTFQPNLYAARRLKASKGDWAAVLDLIDAELRPSALSPEEKAELYFERGAILEQGLADLTGACEAYARAMKLDEHNPQVWLRLAGALARTQNWIGLEELLQRVQNMAVDPKLRASLLIRRAELYFDRFGKPDTASELFEEALEIQQNSFSAFAGLRRLYRENKKWSELIELLEREVRFLDGAAKIYCYYELSRLYAHRFGRADVATGFLEKAEQLGQNDVLVLTELSQLYEQTARFKEQLRVEERLLDVVQDQTEKLAIHHRAGMICEDHLGDDERAIKHYRAAVELRPTYSPAVTALGRLYRKHGRFEEILKMHKKEVHRATQVERQALAHYRAAELLVNELNRPDEAVAQYEEALRWVPSFLPAEQALIQLYTRLERWEDLVKLYEKGAEISRGKSLGSERQEPLRVARLEQIGRLWEDKVGDFDRAAETYKLILEIDPGNLGALFTLKRICTKAKRWSELLELLEREAELAEDEARAAALLHQIGEIAEVHLQDRNLAVLHYRRALTIRPSYVPTLTALGRMFYKQGRYNDLIAMQRKEAEVTEDAQRRAAIAYSIGEIYENRLKDLEKAEESYRQALELDSELWSAIRSVERLLSRRRGWADLAEVLERQAGHLENPKARAVAFFRVGELWDKRLDDLSNAWDAYDRVLTGDPNHYPARVALSRIAWRRGHWNQLVEIFREQRSTLSSVFAKLEVLWELALVLQYELESLKEAKEAYIEMVALRSDDLTALLGMAELCWITKDNQGLAEACSRLKVASEDPLIKIGALRELARVTDLLQRDPTKARELWNEVLSLKSDDIAARRALGAEVGTRHTQIRSPEVFATVELLRAQSQNNSEALDLGIDAITKVYSSTRDWAGLSLAFNAILDALSGEEAWNKARLRVQSARTKFTTDSLGDGEEVEGRLRAVLEDNPKDRSTRKALADFLARDKTRLDEAIAEHFHVVSESPCRLSSLRSLERLFREANELDQAHLALAVLTCFKATTPKEEERYNSGRRALSEEQGSPIAREVLEKRVFSDAEENPPAEAVALLRVIEPHLSKIYSPDLGAFGLNKKDRIPPPERHPLRRRGEILAWLLGVPAFDIYLHQVPGRNTGLELTETPALILPQAAASWPAERQLFQLGMLMSELALGTWVARKMSPFEFERLLTALTRIHVHEFAQDRDTPDGTDNLRRKLERVLPESTQADLVGPTRAYAKEANAEVDFDGWLKLMVRANRRVGLLFCDDFESALHVLSLGDERIASLPRETTEQMLNIYQNSDMVRDLLPWALSQDHVALRRLAGFTRER